MATKTFLVKIAKLRSNESIKAIVRFEGEENLALSYFKNNNILVRRTYRIIKAFSVQTTPPKLLKLANQNWVKKIEEDKKVKAF